MFRREFITAVVLMAISISILVLIQFQVNDVRVGRPGYLIVVTPKSFPMFSAGLMFIISSFNLIKVLKNSKITKENSEIEFIDLKAVLPVFCSLVLYAFSLEVLGYMISTIALTVFMLYYFRARPWQIFVIGLFFPPMVFYIFSYLYVPLPKGIFG